MKRSGRKVGTYLKGNTFAVLEDGKTAKVAIRDRQNNVVAYSLVDLCDICKVGKATWLLNRTTGYIYASVWAGVGKRKYPRLHQFVMGSGTKDIVDHINHDKLDNRKDNLRLCTKSQNGHNSKPFRANNTSGFRGVSHRPKERRRKKYQACLQVDGKTVGRARFMSFDEAVKQRLQWEKEYNPTGLHNV